VSNRNAFCHLYYMAWPSVLLQEKQQINKLKPDTASLTKSTMKYLDFVDSWQFVWDCGTHATGQLETTFENSCMEEYLHLAVLVVKLGTGLQHSRRSRTNKIKKVTKLFCVLPTFSLKKSQLVWLYTKELVT